MRWFKHLTRAHLDEEIAALIHEDGLEAYGFYWILLEVIAEAMDATGKCELTHTLPQWSHLCYSHHHRVSKYLGKLRVRGLVTVMYDGCKITVGCRNLLKYRDEYSKKSGQTKKSVGSKRQSIDTDTDTDKERTKPLFGKPEQPEKTTALETSETVDRCALEIHKRHVARKCSLKITREKLTAILRKTKTSERDSILETVNRNHRAWCASEDWTKDGGQFCPGLDKWLNIKHERYLTIPGEFMGTSVRGTGIVAETMRYLNEHPD